MRRFKNNKDIEHVLRGLLTDKPQTTREIHHRLEKKGYRLRLHGGKGCRHTEQGRTRALAYRLHRLEGVRHEHVKIKKNKANKWCGSQLRFWIG